MLRPSEGKPKQRFAVQQQVLRLQKTQSSAEALQHSTWGAIKRCDKLHVNAAIGTFSRHSASTHTFRSRCTTMLRWQYSTPEMICQWRVAGRWLSRWLMPKPAGAAAAVRGRGASGA